MIRARTLQVLALLACCGLGACQRQPPPKRYALQGQVLAVRADRQQITIKHADIEGFMPAMTMSYAVASPALLEGRSAGELITASLEVSDLVGRLVEITHVGSAPLPDLNNGTMAAALLDVGDKVPDAALIDQHDKRRSFSEWSGTTTLLTFIYTRCPLPDFCPLMDQNFATLQRNIGRESALRGRVKLVSVSFDPDNDTPAVLSQHAEHLKADPAVWTFLTGDRVPLDRFAAMFGVSVVRAPEGSTGITHNLRTTLIGADGRIVKIYSGSDWTPGSVLADLRAAVGPAR